MRSPEELKAQAIDESGCCGTCEYYRTTYDHPFGCAEAQAKTMIVQELVEYTEQLESRLAQVEQERDAAVTDLDKSLSWDEAADCHFCKHRAEKCLECNFEWRGVCPENTKEDHNDA